jgi:hypothetical protein
MRRRGGVAADARVSAIAAARFLATVTVASVVGRYSALAGGPRCRSGGAATTAPVPSRVSSPHMFELRCAELHPVRATFD